MNKSVGKLFEAINDCDLEGVKKSFASGFDINTVYRGDTPLTAASYRGDIDTVKFLVSKGADLDCHGYEGGTPLMLSTGNSNEIFDFLLENGADFLRKSKKDGRNALMWAAKNRNLHAVSVLLKKGVNILDKDRLGKTALMHAMKDPSLPVIEKLIDSGAQVADHDDSGWSPVMHACNFGAVATILDRLAVSGAVFNEVSATGDTCLTLAARNFNEETIQYLLSKGITINGAGRESFASLIAVVAGAAKLLVGYQYMDARTKEAAEKKILESLDVVVQYAGKALNQNRDFRNAILQNISLDKTGILKNYFLNHGFKEFESVKSEHKSGEVAEDLQRALSSGSISEIEDSFNRIAKMKDLRCYSDAIIAGVNNRLIGIIKSKEFAFGRKLIEIFSKLMPRLDQSSKFIEQLAANGLVLLIQNEDQDLSKLVFSLIPSEISDTLLAYNLSCYYALQKNKLKMLKAVEKAIKIGNEKSKFLTDSDFKPYLSDPDFQRLLK